MAQIVKLRRSSISGQKPTNSHLQLGEIALNTTDGKAFLAVSGSLGESVQEFITTNASNTGSIYLSGSIKLQGDESISGSLLMTGSIINVDSISYNTGSNSNLYPGVRRWNSDAGTTELRLSGNNVTLQDGQEILYRVYNSTLSPITDGTPVTVIGSYQGHDSVEPAFAGGGDNTKYRVIGVATETINPAEFGFITRIGIIHDLNLSGFTLGEEVYLSQTEYGKLAHKEDLSISGRTIELGVVLDNSSTTGSLRLQIFNESGIQQNTSAEINTFTVNDTSTGIFNFGGITVATPTTFNVGTINGWIVDNATDPLKPYSKYVEYSGSNGLTTEYLTTSIATYLLLNESGSIVSQSNFPTSENRRRMIYLGKLIHSDKTTIRLAENTPDIMYSPLSQLREFLSPIRLINNGVSPTPDGANLSFSISGGYLHGFGVNYINDHYNPNVLYIPPQAVTTFQYRTQTGGTYTDVTTISPTYYDNNGVRTLIAGDPKQSTNQRIFLTSAGGILVQYGQTVYSKIEDAIAGIPSENFVTFPPIKENAILIGIVSLSIGATNLNDVTKAKFTLVGKFGETIGGTGGSISASDITLQNAYDNSTDPEIITNAILDGVTIKRGSSSDTDNLIVFKNGNDEIKSYVKATGDSLFNNSIFSGSIHVLGKITGSANFATLDNLPTLVSGSGQISFTGITDKPTLVSGSSQVSFTGLTDKPTLVSGSSQVSFTGLSSIPAGIVSGSSQVSYTGLSNIPVGIISGAAQLPAGTVSGSSQVSFNGITDKPTLVSGSGQISFNGITDKPTLVSGSSQVSYTGLSNIPVGIISGAAQLPAGTVSGSSQVSFTGITDKPTLVSGSSQVSYTGLSSIPAGIVSGAVQVKSLLPAGTVSGSSQVSFTGITDKPTLVSGSVQVDITQTTGYSAFSSSISSSIGGLSSSIASTDSTQNGRLSSIEGKTGSISDLNTYTGSNNTVIGTLQTATSSLNSFTSSIHGAIEVTGSNLTVKGDFLVKGTTTIIDSTTLDIKDNIIQLNGTGATNGGLVVRDATAPNTVSGSLLWDTTNDKWIAGQVGFEQPIVLSTTFNSDGDSRYLQVTGGTLNGALTIVGALSGVTTLSASDNITTSGRLLAGNATDGVAIYRNDTYGDIIGINTSLSEYNDLRLRASLSDQMFLRTNGNVDIGYSTAQGSKFAVNGSGFFNGNVSISSTGNLLFVVQGNETGSGIYWKKDQSPFVSSAAIVPFYDGQSYNRKGIGFYTGDFEDFTTESVLRMVILRNGNVGIGYTDRSEKFAVNGSGYFNGNLQINGALSGATTGSFSSSIRVGNVEGQDTTSVFGGYGISNGSARYGNYGQIILDASSGWTAGAKRWLITNAYQANKFAIIRSINAETNPSLTTSGEIGSGFADFIIDANGAATFSSTVSASGFIENGTALASKYTRTNGSANYLYTPSSLTVNLNTVDSLAGIVYTEGSNCTNAPTTYGSFLQLADEGGNDIRTQFWNSHNGDEVYTRIMWGNTNWKPWRKLWHDGNLNPANYALASSLSNYSLTSHTHSYITSTRYDSGDPKPNQLTVGLSFQFSYPDGGWYNAINMRSYSDPNYLATQIVSSANNPGSDTGYSFSLKYREGRNTTWLGWKTILDSSNFSSYTDSRYYTETEIDNYFSGAIGITGYNKSNWDTAYSYSQIGHLPLSGGTLRGIGSVALTLDSATTSTALAIRLNGNTQGYLAYSSFYGIAIMHTYTSPTALIGILYDGSKTPYFSSDNGTTKNTLLHAGNYSSYSPTLTGGNASGTWGIHITGNSTAVNTSIGAGSEANLVYTLMADNDYFRIRAGGSSNSGWAEIATADDGNEPIYVRQYSGVFSSVVRTLSLLDGSGNTTFPGIITENSSLRYKKDITTITNALDIVNSMRGVKYIKLDNNVSEIGVIAEEISEILPEVVIYDSENRPDSVSYGRITAVLIEAIKELKQQVEDLRKNG